MKFPKLLMFTAGLVTLIFTQANAQTDSSNSSTLDKVRTGALPGTVALTFDDGPSPVFTPKVLAILKKYNIKATFFVMGWAAKKHPELIKQMIAEGHAVGVHTNSHPMLTKIPESQYYYEVVNPKLVVKSIIGKYPVCLRPPYGAINQHVKDYIRSQGLIPVAMGFNSFDYDQPGVDHIVNWVVSNARSGRVVLLHDGLFHRYQTVDALPRIIEGIRKKGLGFSAICYPQ